MNGFTDTIAGFARGDVLIRNLLASATTLSFNAAHDRLTRTEGSTSSTLQLAGSYQASNFFLFSDNGLAAIGHT